MKYIIVLCLLLTGCATVSEYDQGCRDGIESVRINGNGPVGSKEGRERFCDDLDRLHRDKKEVEGRGRR